MFHCLASLRSSSYGVLALCFVGSLALAPSALAADLDPGYADVPQTMPEQQVTFGSGWYIRGDIGVTRLPSMKINDPTFPTQNNPTIPGAPTATITQGSAVGYVGSIGAGYQISNWFRGDVVADFHEPLSVSNSAGNGGIFCPTGVSYPNQVGTDFGAPRYASGGCTASEQGSISSYDVLVNGYVDLGNWYSVTPYIGAGVGASFGHYQTSSTYTQSNNTPYQVSYTDPQFATTYSQNYDRTSSGNYYSFAWALMGGVAIDVYQHTKLDIGYRYLNLGQIPGVSNKLTSQEVRAGLRYMIDN